MVWLIVLSKAEVSYAYPLISLGYVFTAVLARLLFGEAVGLMRMAGIVITCLRGCSSLPAVKRAQRDLRNQESRSRSEGEPAAPGSRLARQVAPVSKEHG